MSTTGIMEEIWELLSQGKTSSEIIALGHKPPTVYKVQRQIRERSLGIASELIPGPDRANEATPAESQREAAELHQRIATLEAEIAKTQALHF
jgi:hypothetical protein